MNEADRWAEAHASLLGFGVGARIAVEMWMSGRLRLVLGTVRHVRRGEPRRPGDPPLEFTVHLDIDLPDTVRRFGAGDFVPIPIVDQIAELDRAQ